MNALRKHPQLSLTALLLAITLALAGMVALQPAPVLHAAMPIIGTQTATAGTGGVTAKRFVRLEAAGQIYPATAVSHKVCGVAETTTAQGKLAEFAPMGTVTTVTSGEQIAVGDLLTATTAGKAAVLVPGAGTQRIAGMALTAAASADLDLKVLLLTGSDTAHLDPTADVTISANKKIEFTAGTGYLRINGATSGGIKILPTATGTDLTTLTNTNGAAGTLTLPLGTDTLVARTSTDTMTNKTLTSPVISGGSIASATSIGAVGAINGGITIAPIATGTATATIQNQNVAASIITLPSATCTLPGLGLANTWAAAQTFSAVNVHTLMPTIPATTASSAGTVQGDATAITTGFTVVTGASNAGVKLPAASNGAIAIIKYTATGNLKIYPAGSDAINALGASNALTIAAPVCTMLVCQGTTWYTMPVVPS